MTADEYRYWQSRPAYERTDAVSELTQEQYAMKGQAPEVPGLQRTLVHFQRNANSVFCRGSIRRRNPRGAPCDEESRHFGKAGPENAITFFAALTKFERRSKK
jgi:hypothetical protein